MKSFVARLFAALGTGFLTALLAALLGGLAADLAAGWYRVPSMEGQSGYFVLFLALFGFIAGFVLGFVLSIFMTRKPGGGLRALWLAPLVALGCIAAVTVASRFLADIPPRHQGAELNLALELSWPLADAPTLPQAGDEAGWKVELYSVSGETLRSGVAGPIWTDDARTEDGRLIVPAALEVFTSRGKRLLLVSTGKAEADGFQVPLPAFPGVASLAWSDWLPKARAGGPVLPDGLRYRFRVVPRNEPIRSETLGPFIVETVADGFHAEYSHGQPTRIRARGHFRIRHRDQPVIVPADLDGSAEIQNPERFHAVALVPGQVPALVVQCGYSWNGGPAYLLTSTDGLLRWTSLGRMPGDFQVHALDGTDTVRRFVADGRVDRSSFRSTGIHAVAGSLLDTASLGVTQLADARVIAELDQYRPLAVAPDARRFARMIRERDGVRLVEVEIASTHYREVSMAHARVPTGAPEDADAAWFRHYFDWACPDGEACAVVARSGVNPLPRRGSLNAGDGYGRYVLQPAGDALQDALVAFLVSDLGGRRLQPEYEGDVVRVRIDGAILNLSFDEGLQRLSVWSSDDPSDRALIRVSAQLDEALRSGRFDSGFADFIEE